MTTTSAEHGVITEAGAIRFERLLPGPIERVWAYLTVPAKRRLGLADGPMALEPGGAITLVWRNSQLARPDETMPERYARFEGFSMTGRILQVEPPRLLVHSWDEDAEVRYELAERGDRVLLTLTTSRVPSRAELVDVAGGWHGHLAMLAARLEGAEPPRFWDLFERLHRDYEARIPAE